MIIIEHDDDILSTGILRHQSFLGVDIGGSVYKVTPSVVDFLRDNSKDYLEVEKVSTLFGPAFMFLKKKVTGLSTTTIN